MLEPTITNLRVLAKINIQDKLSVSNNYIYISPPVWSRPLRRRFTSNSRNVSLETLNSTVTRAFELTNTLMNSVASEGQNTDAQKQRDYCALKNMFDAMETSITGLQNLKISYQDDASFIASIEGIICSINDQNDALRQFISEYTSDQ